MFSEHIERLGTQKAFVLSDDDDKRDVTNMECLGFTAILVVIVPPNSFPHLMRCQGV